MRPYFHMSDLEPATTDHAKLFAKSYLPERHRGPYLERFTEGGALERLWPELDPSELERLIWADARIGCHYVHLPYAERLELEQRDRLKWDAMMVRHLQEEVEEQLNGVH